MFEAPKLNIILISPWLIIIGAGLLLMVLDLVVRRKNKVWMAWLSMVGFGLAFVQTIALWGIDSGTFIPANGIPMVVVDNFSLFLQAIFLLTGFMSILLSVDYLKKTELNRGEYYYLMLFSISGMMLMSMANDLILVFLALELLSIPLYVLAGFALPKVDSEESALKYFLLGAFASGFLVFGIAMIYGATGSTSLPTVLEQAGQGGTLTLLGAVMLLVGFGFKVAAVPFHMWTPDVYEGAPTSVTAFMSVGAKVAGFAALIRIFIYALPDLNEAWVPAMAVIAALTMILGNVVAIVQGNIKRMLGYSSIAHAGFILMGVAAAHEADQGMSAALFYMFAYLFTNLGAFAIIVAVEKRDGQGVLVEDYKGFFKRSPWLALAMAFFMLSLTGVPPTGGFTAKFGVFGAAVEAGLVWLTIIAVVTSVVSAYYYLRVVYYSFMFDSEDQAVIHIPAAAAVAVLIGLVVTFLLGIYPDPIFEVTRNAVFSGVQALAGG